MIYNNYSYDEDNYPSFSDADVEKNRIRIVEDSYWNATNLKSIIEESYDTSRVIRLYNRKEEMIFSLVALTCELYMKSLIYFNEETKKMVRGHGLDLLYEELPKTIKERIKELTAEDDFEIKLKDNKDVFPRFRYSFEMKGYKINAHFLLSLMNALNVICKELYPTEVLEGVDGFYKCGYASDGINYGIKVE